MRQFEIIIHDRAMPNKNYYRVPLEHEYDSHAKTTAGHILRGACVRHEDFSLMATLLLVEEGKAKLVVAVGHCVPNAVHSRGPNAIKIDGIIRHRSPEEMRERKLARPKISKVIWA